MSPSPIVLVLEDFRVHVGSINGHDVVAHIKAPVNEYLSVTSTLHIPYINPDNHHIRF